MNYDKIKSLVDKYLMENESSQRRFMNFSKQPWYETYRQVCDDLAIHNSISSERQRYYHFSNKLGSIPTCKQCDNQLKFYENFNHYKTYCSSKCQNNDPEKIKYNKTKMAEYWSENIEEKSQKRKDQTIAGLLKNSGCSSIEEYSAFRKNNWLNETSDFLRGLGFDVDNMTEEEMKASWGRHFGDKIKNSSDIRKKEIQTRRENTNLAKYGTKGVLGNANVQAKYRATNKARRGVEYVLQDPNVFEKAYSSRCKKKDYILPSGEIVKVQGYEPLALNKLLAAGTSERDMQIADSNFNVKWVDSDGKIRTFYPDIYVVSQNRIVEVKSTYTWAKDEAINLAKQRACREQGYICEFWVFDGKGNLEIK